MVVNAKKLNKIVWSATDLGGVIWRGELGPLNRAPFLPNITLELCDVSGALGFSFRLMPSGSQASVLDNRWWLL